MAQNKNFISPINIIIYYPYRCIPYPRAIIWDIRDIVSDFRSKHKLDLILCHVDVKKIKNIIENELCDIEIYIRKKLIKKITADIKKDSENILDSFNEFINQNEKEILQAYEQNLKLSDELNKNMEYEKLYLFYKGFDKKKELFYLKKLSHKNPKYRKIWKKKLIRNSRYI